MKIRLDFVTNSSSTSYIVSINNNTIVDQVRINQLCELALENMSAIENKVNAITDNKGKPIDNYIDKERRVRQLINDYIKYVLAKDNSVDENWCWDWDFNGPIVLSVIPNLPDWIKIHLF